MANPRSPHRAGRISTGYAGEAPATILALLVSAAITLGVLGAVNHDAWFERIAGALPWPVWLVAFAVAAPLLLGKLVGYGRSKLVHEARLVAQAVQPCPRCEVMPRSDSGWCPSCHAALAASPAGPENVYLRLQRAIARRDAEAVTNLLGSPVVTHRWDERRPMISGERRAERSAQVAGEVLRDQRTDVEAAFVEPRDPDCTWLRLRSTYAAPGVPGLEGTRIDVCIVKCRTTGGRLVEQWSFVPLQVAAPLVAACD